MFISLIFEERAWISYWIHIMKLQEGITVLFLLKFRVVLEIFLSEVAGIWFSDTISTEPYFIV